MALGVSDGISVLVTIDPATGVTTRVGPISPRPVGDIDIDGSGVIRAVNGSTLIKYDLYTRGVISSASMPEAGNPDWSPIVYVP